MMNIKKIRLVPNYRKKWAVKLVHPIAAFLKMHGYVVAHRNVDATICIGGDGTIFYANHRKRIHGAILGIGSHTSAVCQLKRDNWKRNIIRILKEGSIEKRLTVRALIGKKHIHALNDIVLHTHDYRVIRVSLWVNGKKYLFEGDGIIVSTPVGSTAYAYSAGGISMKQDVKKIQVVPICPYKRTLKPMILSKNAKIIISADRSSDFIIDGIYIGRLKPKIKVFIEKGNDVLFIK